ncbi:transporter [Methanobrevibacter sp. YE315]|uniref:AEC family transporter n=1 Tax=Methanobrevibacter sp. YE315 TaxID=1609968 RepID=UPI000764E28A|nr:AEC family transporter [Methanobrevibacter sp. YE315]AMD16625.1 transporter [Methanobrevibacter sp. YE315]
MNNIEITILSIILMIALGYFLKRIDFLSESDIDPFNKIVMYILLPCMIFHAIYSSDLSLIPKLGILPFIVIVSSLVTGAVSYFVLKRLGFDDVRLWSVLVTVMIANTGFMGYPVTLGIFGQEGFLRAIFCDMATLCIFLFLSFLLILRFGGTIKTALKKILLFPTLWAVVLGLAFNSCGIPIGPVLDNTINYLGQGAIPLIMIALGLSIDFSAISRSKSMIAFTSVMKLAFFPFVAFVIASQLGLVDLQYKVSIVEAAMPSGMMSLLLAITYKLDYELTSDCILINTVISLITLPLIIMIL